MLKVDTLQTGTNCPHKHRRGGYQASSSVTDRNVNTLTFYQSLLKTHQALKQRKIKTTGTWNKIIKLLQACKIISFRDIFPNWNNWIRGVISNERWTVKSTRFFNSKLNIYSKCILCGFLLELFWYKRSQRYRV